VVPATLSPSYGAERRRLDRAAEVLAGRLGEEAFAEAARRGGERSLEDAAQAAVGSLLEP
ncbi:MAG: hypothetical protein H5T83_01870, partial [Actinotalea sp.]|nr:hypothetical protein [Actinotalea sp.]